jgi:putative ABC transport system substrate-binding protein
VGYLASRSVWESPYGAVVQGAAQRLGIFLIGAPLDGSFAVTEYPRVFAAMGKGHADAVLASDQVEHTTYRQLIVELAEKARLPAAYSFREFVEIGGLMAYAVDGTDMFRHAASAVSQILNRPKPSDIPYYQMTKFALVINLKTAKTLGIEVSSSLLARAGEVIE